ncbi:Vta1 like-domain-containing protein [Lipomyces chichibuensis]|uniref:Vta1 like-domain-containing protein n=1 Tax=Lipomyces chichibuensis TaxID=1546026 RepID=UPI0033440B5A
MAILAPPPSLKFITNFVKRANELENSDPVISYYCKYYAIEEALAAKVHQTDPSAAEYITNLLDAVEKDKSNLNDRDTITDEMVGQAYVERFATRVFANADKDIINKKVTRTTAPNLLAASNFLELLKLFGDPDQGLLDRIKYCKFHAARILKSYASGEDPNEYELPEVTSEGHALEPESTKIDNISSSIQRVSLDGTSSVHSLSSTPSLPMPSSPPLLAPGVFPVAVASAPPLTFAPPVAAPRLASASPPQSYHHQQQHQVSKTEVQQIMDEAERFSLAQKHSRYAISALNYEDVDTAVKELKAALKLLGESVS